MLAVHTVRRYLLTAAVTLIALLVVSSAANAGTITRDGSTLVYTSKLGQQDVLEVRQALPTSITFDDALAVVVNGGGANCAATAGDSVTCTGVVWTGVTLNLGTNDDVFQANIAGLPVTAPITASGGPGTDRLEGGGGNDVLELDEGGGTALGDIGSDILRAGTEASTLTGGPGDDVLRSGTQASTLSGGLGSDTLDLRAQTSMVRSLATGGDGNDSLLGGAAPTYLIGGAGNDEVTGGSGNEVIDGGVGADSLLGGDGFDDMSGGATNVGDFYTSDGPDLINGGAGIDNVRYPSRTTGVTIDLATPTGNGEAGENDTLAGFENATGGDAGDALFGNAQSNLLDGGNGADAINGRGGFDQLVGDADADTITASGDGVADLVDCGTFATSNQPPLADGTDADTANVDHLDLIALTGDCETVNRLPAPALPPAQVQTGTPQADVLRGTAVPDGLNGRAGNDTLRGFGGNDRIRGGAGDDDLFGGNGADDIKGEAGNDLLQGDNGDDSLDGGPGRDVLRGGRGRDLLVGGRGLDNLDGGVGPDVLSSRDRAGGDVVSCTRVNLRTRFGRAQRDSVIADRSDVIVNRRFCLGVSFT